VAAPSRKSERLMNLVICLLVSRRFVPKAKLRQLVEDYREQTPEAFEKMFERDKEELRDLGIPIEVGQVSTGFEDEPGYRIQRSEFEVPPLTFTAAEAAVLGLAARVWQHAGLAEATSRAVLKLDADGLDTDTSLLGALEPRLPANEQAFEPLWHAVQSRTVVTFDYRRPGGPGPQHRRLQPWGILNWRSRWYVVGHDEDRQDTRIFRLSRITGKVRLLGRAGAFTVPEGVDLRAEAERLAPAERRGTAQLRVRAGHGNGLRRRASSVAADPAHPGWDVIELVYGDAGNLAEEVAAYASDVIVLDPPDIRDTVIQHLKSLVADTTETAAAARAGEHR
jgi:proteasome accessory factor B